MAKPFSSRCMRPEDWETIRHFKAVEFKYPEKMGYEFVVWLDELRERAGVPMYITSDHRSHAHNDEVGGASDSAHEDVPCNAVDIGQSPRPSDMSWNYTRWRINSTAMDMGCKRIGNYPNGSIHLDRTEGRRPAPRMWNAVAR